MNYDKIPLNDLLEHLYLSGGLLQADGPARAEKGPPVYRPFRSTVRAEAEVRADGIASLPGPGKPLSPASSGGKHTRPRIMLVAESSDELVRYKTYLAEEGFAVSVACTAWTAEKRLHVQHHDAIAIDGLLPDEDGWQLTRRLKGAPGTAHLPVLALTSDLSVANKTAAWEAGCDAFLAKPCDRPVLSRVLRTLLGDRAVSD